MAEWGLWVEDLDGTALSELLQSWKRRKKFENRTLAVAVVNALGEAMGGESARKDGTGNKVSNRAMLSEMGVTF